MCQGTWSCTKGQENCAKGQESCAMGHKVVPRDKRVVPRDIKLYMKLYQGKIKLCQGTWNYTKGQESCAKGKENCAKGHKVVLKDKKWYQGTNICTIDPRHPCSTLIKLKLDQGSIFSTKGTSWKLSLRGKDLCAMCHWAISPNFLLRFIRLIALWGW